MKFITAVKSARIIFITGTDTGVGKTFLTALLLRHLRNNGVRALGMKPFCSGSWADARMLRAAQGNELSLKQITPFYFSKPVAPMAAKKDERLPSLRQVVRKIQEIATLCDLLLIEGVGGLFVPLRKDYFVIDLIASLKCEVVLVGRNHLGTLNHTLLSVHALKTLESRKNLKIVLMEQFKKDFSSRSNRKILQQLLRNPVFAMPFYSKKTNENECIEENSQQTKKTLADLIGDTYFPPRSLGTGGTKRKSRKKFQKAIDS